MWVKVPYTYVVPDFCAVEFNKNEFWYDAIKGFEGDQRLCPPPKDVSFSMKSYLHIMLAMQFTISLQTIFNANEVLVQTRYEIPIRVDEGEYRCTLEASQGKKVEICVMMYGEAHEVL